MTKLKHFPVSIFSDEEEINCGDAYRSLQSLPPHSYDAIITDPPYNLGIAGKSWDDKDLDIELLAYHFHRALKPAGNVFVFCSDFQFGRWYEALSIYFSRLRKFAWCKSNPRGWIRGKFIESFELALHACNKDGYFNRDEKFLNHMTTALTSGKERLKRPAEERGGQARGDRSLHPTQKPLELMKHVISALTKEGDVIFDPFSGTGTTAAAAKELGRKCAVVEYDLSYFTSGATRLSGIKKK